MAEAAGYQDWGGGTAWDFTSKVTHDMTLYAHWTALTLLALAPTALDGTVGVPYSAQLGSGTDASFIGGPVPPPGLTFTNGVLAGTPTTAGTFSLLVVGTSPHATTVSRLYSATIAKGVFSAPTPTVSGIATPSAQLTAIPGAWSPTPAALTEVWKSHGVVVGTGAGYTVRAADLGHTITVEVTGTRPDYTDLTVASAGVLVGLPPALIASTTANGQALSAFSFDPAGLNSGGAATSASLSGALPSGLQFSTTTGDITGTPTAAGDFPVTVTLGDDWGSATIAVDVVIAPLYGAPTISGNPAVGQTVTADPGTWVPAPAPGDDFDYQWYRGTSKIPLGQGGRAASYQVRAADEARLLSVVVTDPANGVSETSPQVLAGFAPKMPNATEIEGQATVPLKDAVPLVTGTAPTFSLVSGALPPGVDLRAHSGRLVGTPTASGTFVADIQAHNQWGDDVVTVTFVIQPGPIASLPPDAGNGVGDGRFDRRLHDGRARCGR